jgi:hypothetical protein
MRVGGPRVGRGEARDLPGGGGRRRGPEPEGTVDVNPGAMITRPADQRYERVARPAARAGGLTLI